MAQPQPPIGLLGYITHIIGLIGHGLEMPAQMGIGSEYSSEK